MQIGTLDRRITLQKRTDTTDLLGQDIPAWSTLAIVWGKIVYDRANERMEADQRVALSIVRFMIRYIDLDETCRILYNGKYFDVLGVERLHRNKYLILKCQYADRGI